MESSSAPDRLPGSTWGPDGDRLLKKLTTLGRGAGAPGKAKPAKEQRPKSCGCQIPPGSPSAALASGPGGWRAGPDAQGTGARRQRSQEQGGRAARNQTVLTLTAQAGSRSTDPFSDLLKVTSTWARGPKLLRKKAGSAPRSELFPLCQVSSWSQTAGVPGPAPPLPEPLGVASWK